MMFADQLQQAFFNIRTEFFKAQYLADAIKRLKQKALRQRMRRANLDQFDLGVFFQKLRRVRIADARGYDRLIRAAR